MKIYAFIIAMLLITAPCLAGQVTQGDIKITKVMAGYQDGQVYFYIDKTPLNPQNCTQSNNGKVLVVDPNRSDVSHVLSVLLTAKASNANVEVQIYDDYCYSGYAAIRRVAVY